MQVAYRIAPAFGSREKYAVDAFMQPGRVNLLADMGPAVGCRGHITAGGRTVVDALGYGSGVIRTLQLVTQPDAGVRRNCPGEVDFKDVVLGVVGSLPFGNTDRTVAEGGIGGCRACCLYRSGRSAVGSCRLCRTAAVFFLPAAVFGFFLPDFRCRFHLELRTRRLAGQILRTGNAGCRQRHG